MGSTFSKRASVHVTEPLLTKGVAVESKEAPSSLPNRPSEDPDSEYMWSAKSVTNCMAENMQEEGWTMRAQAPFVVAGYPEHSVYFFCKARN